MAKLLTARELAEALSLSVETIWRYTRHERIPSVKVGDRQYRYDKEAVLAALKGQGLAVREEHTGCLRTNYTYSDYLKFPEEPGYRCEILEGLLVKEPSPSVHHQRVSLALARQLGSYFEGVDPEGEIFLAPLDVTLGDGNVVQPDILFVSSARRDIMRKNRIDGACHLVVEVISEGKSRKDRVLKMNIYLKAGIPHYWIVDPEEDTLEAFALKDERYVLVLSGSKGDAVTHPDFAGLELDLDKVFHRPSPGFPRSAASEERGEGSH